MARGSKTSRVVLTLVLTSCALAPEPTFYTEQGIPIVLEKSAHAWGYDPKKEHFDFVFDLIFSSARQATNIKAEVLIERITDSGMRVYVVSKDLGKRSDHPEIGGFMLDDAYCENRVRGDLAIVVHEMAHALQFYSPDPFIDYDHEDEDFFGESGLTGLAREPLQSYCESEGC